MQVAHIDSTNNTDGLPSVARSKVPVLSGKQRKRNVNVEVNNVQVEFLKEQIKSLKSTLSQKEAELKEVI